MRTALSCALLFTLASGIHANAQDCLPHWDPDQLVGNPGMPAEVRSLVEFNDGSGAGLYAGGFFATAGGLPAAHIARWDGLSWSAVGSGTDGAVLAMAVFDDGGGPALFAAGNFLEAGGVPANRIARWDGRQWSALGDGLNGEVRALAVFDEPDGPALYAGGLFTAAGGSLALGVARWDGITWSALDNGGVNGYVLALKVYKERGRPALFVGGSFIFAGRVSANNIARWNGHVWSAVGGGLFGYGPDLSEVRAMEVFDGGAGPELYAGGILATGGRPKGVSTVTIARWDGKSWSGVGGGLFFGGTPATARSMAVFDDGSGEALYVGGQFTSAGDLTVGRIARWDGMTWSGLDGGVTGGPGGIPAVDALAVFNDGGRESLYVGGSFTQVGNVAANDIAKWCGCP